MGPSMFMRLAAAWQLTSIRPAPLASTPTAAMILRLCLNEIVLQSSEHELSLRQRQPDGPGRILGNCRAADYLVNMDGPIRPDHLHHDSPLHPAPRFPHQADRSTPTFWTVSARRTERLAKTHSPVLEFRGQSVPWSACLAVWRARMRQMLPPSERRRSAAVTRRSTRGRGR
jgi:hypothetical protein